MDDFADRDADGEARASLELDHLGTAAAGAGEDRVGDGGIPARELLERQAGGLGRRPDRHHAVAVLAQDQGRHLRGGSWSFSAIRLRNRAVSSWVPRPITWVGGRSSWRTARYVKTSTGLETTSTIASRLMPADAGLAEDAQEELDVAIDQVEPALVGLAAQAGRDDDHVAFGNGLVAGRADSLIGDQRGAVQQVEGLAADLVGVQVDQVDLADHAAALQGEGRGRADQAAAADDADFHGSFSPASGS